MYKREIVLDEVVARQILKVDSESSYAPTEENSSKSEEKAQALGHVVCAVHGIDQIEEGDILPRFIARGRSAQPIALKS